MRKASITYTNLIKRVKEDKKSGLPNHPRKTMDLLVSFCQTARCRRHERRIKIGSFVFQTARSCRQRRLLSGITAHCRRRGRRFAIGGHFDDTQLSAAAIYNRQGDAFSPACRGNSGLKKAWGDFLHRPCFPEFTDSDYQRQRELHPHLWSVSPSELRLSARPA